MKIGAFRNHQRKRKKKVSLKGVHSKSILLVALLKVYFMLHVEQSTTFSTLPKYTKSSTSNIVYFSGYFFGSALKVVLLNRTFRGTIFEVLLLVHDDPLKSTPFRVL
jgi:hypothetical protein